MTDATPVRRRWVLPVLVIVFILVSVAEVWLLTAVGQRIGVLPTLAILVVEALIGAWLMRREGSKAWRAVVEAYGTGRMPTGQLADAALILVGGVMLILPGFLTDILGLVFLLPWTRPLARRWIGFFVARSAARRGIDLGAMGTPYASGTVIRGETVEDAVPTSEPSPESQVIRGEIVE